MADFAKWVTAAEDGLPWESGSFIKEYENDRAGLVDTAIEADPVAIAVLDLAKQLAPDQQWSSTPTEFSCGCRKLNILARRFERKAKMRG